ncbi:MAG: hypothetical protein HOM68_29830 [Gemmatimonadetes bacterium]|jgi:hypothetical protein|nr:hypothetical protein [Gemmatimonadota bacterium]MBT5060783.1 hypothetical protein [Gemmatimonadota bacterium]MBT5146847.1 hypothetical protein [Gemmatimonadota bacterium]MBT5590136.1 hypothetical protein [Gemmatimonadota bacterium]MBT5961669.1 hypothetical protein [Gemmatimonadota bacterium]
MTLETPPPPEPENKGRRLEDIFILVCVLALWPVVLGLDHILYEVALYGALIGLVVIFVRRVRRFHAARREVEDQLN